MSKSLNYLTTTVLHRNDLILVWSKAGAYLEMSNNGWGRYNKLTFQNNAIIYD